ncbi:hypothetical protein BW723_08020 [Polaribacter reichenbachii]|uniref:Glycosyltransferase n=1 Tax=Polaribacter reichenbachii TaxID=996801 RepID=A0A1B8U6Y0_9FLAO|nr:DUF2064 domain-containing protein [Polaribacter reichenbachii]APZ46245.1 hypothetical protein BW723_08020 [Polaribacter reichenbachii]AUC20107.1 hypothetical protein BTO17_16040 [Polaribacter reichenbachii]OBY67634.1 hypothetical protein LPB301_01470 [Polaribacter reichenbachii]
MNNKTAILIFANSANKEVERKSFLSKEVFAKLNAQTLKTVQKSGLDYFHFSEKNQVGATFGERFTNAIETVFNKGYKNVITIGNDTPHLKTKHLVETANQFLKKELVLGPSKDGGFYLMGISKKQFQKEAFLKLPWQTNRLQSSIVQIATNQKNKISFLEVLNDLDAKEDILKIVNSLKSISLSILKLLIALVCIDKKSISMYKLYTLEKSFSKLFNKGSPVFLNN